MRYRKIDGEEVIIYTEEERQKALQVSLTDLASSLGYTPIRQGVHYSLKEMDSLVIYHDRSWNRWSQKGSITGGSQIDFMLAFGGASSVPDAIQKLLEFNGERIKEVTSPENGRREEKADKEFVLPEKNANYRRLYAYLTQTRGISSDVVSDFVHRKLIYEDTAHHNIVFCGRDPDGNVRYAGLRGTADIYGKKFKMDVAGNDKNYGVNIVNPSSPELKVFESVIDCMSYIDMYGDRTSNKLVLGMVEDNPLAQFLRDYDHIEKITLCLDYDEAGQNAIYGKNEENGKRIGLKEKYEEQGYTVSVEIPPFGKDYNESLLSIKQFQKENTEDFNNKERAYIVEGKSYFTIQAIQNGFSYAFYDLNLKNIKNDVYELPFPDAMRIEDVASEILGVQSDQLMKQTKEIDFKELMERAAVQNIIRNNVIIPGDRFICMSEDRIINEFSILATVHRVSDQMIYFSSATNFGKVDCGFKGLPRYQFEEYYTRMDENLELKFMECATANDGMLYSITHSLQISEIPIEDPIRKKSR